MDVAAIRQQIPATQRVAYFNTGWSGPSPRIVSDRIKEWLDLESEQGPTARPLLERRRRLQEEVRQTVAAFIGASPEEITLTQNTTEGINIVINGLPWRPGDEVVTTSLEHASGIVPCYFLAQRHRVKVRIVNLDGVTEPAPILERIEAALTPRTRLLVLSHIMYTTGLCLPLREIQDLAHDRGALVLVDAAQSAGQMPLNMKALGCDFYAIPGHKWLLGPDGTGALYLRRELIPQVEPPKVGHHAVVSYDMQGHWAPDLRSIQKYELTTTSPALWAGLTAAVGFLQGIGMENVHQRVRELSGLAVARLSALPGIAVLSPRHPRLASGLVTFAVAGVEPQAVVAHLWEQGKIVARWVDDPPGVRLSVAFFNTEEEVAHVAACLEALPARGLR